MEYHAKWHHKTTHKRGGSFATAESFFDATKNVRDALGDDYEIISVSLVGDTICYDAIDKSVLTAFAQGLRNKSEKYYQEWEFCQKHHFELEAKHQKELSDVLARIVLDIEHEFDVDVQY